MTIIEVVSRLKKSRKTSKGFNALCPAHDDKSPSLSISEGNHRTVLHCFAGCHEDAILEAIGLEKADLFSERETPLIARLNANRSSTAAKVTEGAKVIDRVYRYTSAEGAILYENVRYLPKGFRQRRPDRVGGYIYNLDGIERVPYRLAELIEKLKQTDAEIWLTEGEKDADNLRMLGFTATSFKKWTQSLNTYIKGVHAVLFRDHDRSGVKQANDAASIIGEAAKSVKVIDLFDGELLPDRHGRDVSDWIEVRRGEGLENDEIAETLALFVERSDLLKDWPDARQTGNSSALKIRAMSDIEAKSVEWFVKPLIPFGFFTLCDGIEGLGKTFMMLDIATQYSLGLAMPISGEVLPVGNVLIMSEEDSPEYVLKPRLEKMGADITRIFIIDEPFTMTPEGFAKLERAIVDYQIKFVLIDPIMSYTGKANINNTADVRPITDRLNKIATAHGCVIVGIRHINKSKGYGESRSAGAHAVSWLQGSRSALIIGCDPEDKSRRAIGQHKSNIAAECKQTYGFLITEEGIFE